MKGTKNNIESGTIFSSDWNPSRSNPSSRSLGKIPTAHLPLQSLWGSAVSHFYTFQVLQVYFGFLVWFMTCLILLRGRSSWPLLSSPLGATRVFRLHFIRTSHIVHLLLQPMADPLRGPPKLQQAYRDSLLIQINSLLATIADHHRVCSSWGPTWNNDTRRPSLHIAEY